MKILCLCYEYPPIGGGGGRVAARVNAALAARGHEVRVQTAGMRHLPTHETIDGVEIFRAESFRKKEDTCSVTEMGLYLATSFWPGLRHLQTWKPDIIHAHFAVPTGALAWLLSKITSVPYVITAHLGDVPGGVPEQTAGLFRMIGPLTRPIWSHAAGLTAVSTHVAELAATAYHRNPTVIFNGIPLGPTPKIQTTDHPKILMVGRLSVQKNPLLAIESLSLIRDQPWQCEVIGDGPLRPAMQSAAGRLGIADRVQFSGWLSSENVAAAMQQSEILLMTSLSEGLPVVAVEALAAGLALVTSDIPGVRDVVRNNWNGFTCPLTPEGFATKLRGIISTPARRGEFRRNSRTHAETFELSRTVDQYERSLTAAAQQG